MNTMLHITRSLFMTLFVLGALVSCKNDATPEEETAEIAVVEKNTGEDIQIFRGEFIYLNDAAVLNCGTKIYGVTIDEKMRELHQMATEKKKDEYDMVPVIVRGVVHAKPEGAEGWDEIVTIKEIVKVMEPTGTDVVKIESGKTTGK